MIDIEPIVYTTVHDAIKSAFPDCVVSDLAPEANAVFPFVAITETNNRTYSRTQDDALTEHHALCVYVIEVYSNKQVGRKQECKKIMAVADKAMQEMKFTRLSSNEIPNMDRTIMRYRAQYEVVVEEAETVGDDTIYQTYRR